MFVRERWLSSVCEVITDPSADAFFPTVMEVHSMPSVSSSKMLCADAAQTVSTANINHNVFLIIYTNVK